MPAPLANRATGANMFLLGKPETTYGAAPSGNWVTFGAVSWEVSKAQPLIEEPLLGQGREPAAPARDAIDVTGPAVVPVDKRLIGYWLQLLLGAPAAGVATGSRGFVEFNSNPLNSENFVLDGSTWTFVTAAPTGNETQIGADLQATLDQLVIDLNASADGQIVAATYSRLGNRLVIIHDTPTSAGDTFTLVVTAPLDAVVSKATLYGGGLIKHVYTSGIATLPSMAFEQEHSDLEGGSLRFVRPLGLKLESMEITRARAGSANASLQLVAQDEVEGTATAGGTPTAPVIERFSQFNGSLLVDGVQVANVVGGTLRLVNNLDVVPELREDGLIGGADGGIFGVNLSLTTRFSNNALKAAVAAQAAVNVHYGFVDKIDGAELDVELHEIHLPKPSRPVPGPAGIEVTYEGLGAKEATAGKSATVTLYNDVAGYTT